MIRQLRNALPLIALSACAAPQWHHTELTDPSLVSRQLVIDDGYCKMVARGAVPVPQIASPAGETTSYSGQASTWSPHTGQTSYGQFSGTATTSPAAGFASGFANGWNTGTAILAQREQAAIHKSCMYSKGWTDTSIAASTGSGSDAAVNAAE